MDKSLLNDLIQSNQPFRIETAAGRTFEVPHSDYVRFSPKGTTLFVFYEENGEDHFAMVPLLTITSVSSKGEPGPATRDSE